MILPFELKRLSCFRGVNNAPKSRNSALALSNSVGLYRLTWTNTDARSICDS